MHKLLWTLMLIPAMASADDPAGKAGARLYLSSAAINVMDEFVPLLPAEARGQTACYITTAANLEGHPGWMDEEIAAVGRSGFAVRRIDLAVLTSDTVEDAFADCKSIWVGGGNTYLLLQEIRRSGFDALVKEKIAAGIPYIGTSAGSLVLGPDLECIRFAEEHPDLELELTSLDGLGIFPLLPFVHFDNPAYRDVYRKILDDALENDVAFVTLRENQLIFVDGGSWRIIDADRPGD